MVSAAAVHLQACTSSSFYCTVYSHAGQTGHDLGVQRDINISHIAIHNLLDIDPRLDPDCPAHGAMEITKN